MLTFFRSFFSSKVGIAISIGFLALIALAFAGADIAGNMGAGFGANEKVATVGSQRITERDLELSVNRAIEQMRQQDPQITPAGFIAQGGIDRVLGNLIDLAAVRGFGEKNGIVIGNRLVDSEIAKIGDVRGLDGKVSDQAYQAFLSRNRLTDELLRARITEQLMVRQLLASSDFGIAVPNDLSLRYAQVLTERRSGVIGLLPSSAFAPAVAPGDSQLSAWYAQNTKDYTRPERRVIRYATFTDAAVKTVAPPTDAEIAARYNANKAQYAASESRTVNQLIASTEAAARAIAAEVARGKSLAAAAASKGLAVASLGSLTKDALAAQSSKAAADQVFAAQKGALVGPVKSPLGWALLRVEAITGKPERTLAMVRGELSQQIAVQKRRAALTDFSAQIEDQFDKGASLTDVAKQMGLSLSETGPVTLDGKVYGQPDKAVPAVVAKLVQPAFAMEGQNQPQLAEVEPGKTFVIYDVSSVVEQAAPPLAEIRAQVLADYQMAEGATAARAAALKVEAALKQGKDMAAALATVGKPLPPVERIDTTRLQVQAMGAKTPPPVALMFAIAKGAVRLIAAPDRRGWFVVKTLDVIPGKVEAGSPQLAGLQREFQQTTGQEYAEQLIAAMRQAQGVKRYEPAIKAVTTRLRGGN